MWVFQQTLIIVFLEKEPVLKEKVKKMETIPGVGKLTIATVLGETDGFALIKNNRQLTCFAGYDIVLKESGNKREK